MRGVQGGCCAVYKWPEELIFITGLLGNWNSIRRHTTPGEGSRLGGGDVDGGVKG